MHPAHDILGHLSYKDIFSSAFFLVVSLSPNKYSQHNNFLNKLPKLEAAMEKTTATHSYIGTTSWAC